MKNVYDMVSCEFIDDEPAQSSEYPPGNGYYEDHSLQLQLVEAESTDTNARMPADLAYRIFFHD